MQPLSKPRGRGWSQGEIKAVTLGNELGTSNNVAWKFITVNTGASLVTIVVKQRFSSDCSFAPPLPLRFEKGGMERLKRKNLFGKFSFPSEVELEMWNQSYLLETWSRRKKL